MDIADRREFLAGGCSPRLPVGKVKRREVSNIEIWCECFGKRMEDIQPVDSYKIASIMERISGWERTETRKLLNFYGRQRIYIRSEDEFVLKN